MKTKILLLLTVAIGMTAVSCTNDYEFFDDGWESQSWETTLNQLIFQNASLYANSELFLKDYREININIIDSTSLINKDSRFPVLTGQMITLVPFEFLEFDSLMCHVKASHIKNLLKFSLAHKSELVAVSLKWVSKDDGNISSIALFDKNNGQLIYDNILYNTISMNEEELNKYRRVKLSRSEWAYNNEDYQGSATFYGSDSFYYYSGNGSVSIDLNWTENGWWALHVTDVDYAYRFDYEYRHTNTNWNWNVTNTGISNVGYDARDEATVGGTSYKIKYYMYSGSQPYTVCLAIISDGTINTCYGQGFVKTYSDSPYREPDYVDKNQFIWSGH